MLVAMWMPPPAVDQAGMEKLPHELVSCSVLRVVTRVS